MSRPSSYLKMNQRYLTFIPEEVMKIRSDKGVDTIIAKDEALMNVVSFIFYLWHFKIHSKGKIDTKVFSLIIFIITH